LTRSSAQAAGTPSERRAVDGVLLLDKPRGLSSNAALQRVKRAFRANKAGHTGTLDPLASGLLPICLGEATKFSQALTDSVKVYRTDVTLGVKTETGDAEGRVLGSQPVECTLEQIEAALAALRGAILQVPHLFSALKRDGRALYDYARAGEEIAIAPRPVRIDELAVEDWASPVLTLRVRCSKGTYVRSLAESIGESLGCGAHVSALRRLATGGFAVADAVTLESLETMSEDERDRQLRPVTVLVADLPRITLPTAEGGRFRHGLTVRVREPQSIGADQSVAVFAAGTAGGEATAFVGLGRLTAHDGVVTLFPQRLLAIPPEAADRDDGTGRSSAESLSAGGPVLLPDVLQG
jgi:tRNA pseudouridine55 synthase